MKTLTAVAIFIIFVAAVALFIYIFNLGILNFLLFPSNKVYVSGVSLEINNATQISCFGNVVKPLPGLNITKGAPFNYSFDLTNTCKPPHNITSIRAINNGFSTVVLTPKLQYEMFRNNTVPFTVMVTPPRSFNGGVVTIIVNVT